MPGPGEEGGLVLAGLFGIDFPGVEIEYRGGAVDTARLARAASRLSRKASRRKQPPPEAGRSRPETRTVVKGISSISGTGENGVRGAPGVP